MKSQYLPKRPGAFETVCADPRITSFMDGFWFAASAPARADFLNTHQDYKGLPVVPVAISLRTYIFGRPRIDSNITIRSLNLEDLGLASSDDFSIDEIKYRGSKWFGDYFRAAASVIGRVVGFDKLKGMDLLVKSQIPIGSGLGSSAAVEVAFLTLLDHYLGLNYDCLKIAQLAFQAEREELGIPCGPLDQYGSSIGGMIRIDAKQPVAIDRLPSLPLVFAIVDSGIRHSTGEIHPARQHEIDEALMEILSRPDLPHTLRKKIGTKHNNSQWDQIEEDEIRPYLDTIDKKHADRILFTLRMQRSTIFALDIIKFTTDRVDRLVEILPQEKIRFIRKQSPKIRRLCALGEIVNYQHELLRDLYDVSLPALEKIRQAALDEGALGVKISGAGMGGALIALARSYNEAQKIVDASIQAGAVQGWVSKPEGGAQVEKAKP